MHGAAGPLVQRGLVPDPEVDPPVQGASLVQERVQHDVAVPLVELAVHALLNLAISRSVDQSTRRSVDQKISRSEDQSIRRSEDQSIS